MFLLTVLSLSDTSMASFDDEKRAPFAVKSAPLLLPPKSQVSCNISSEDELQQAILDGENDIVICANITLTATLLIKDKPDFFKISQMICFF
mgnify:CR=1 FL=1